MGASIDRGRYIRVGRIVGVFDRNVPGSTEILRRRTVGIAGCGGLGSNAAVSLVRAGVGSLILADFDFVEESNLNRQYFFLEDIGKLKVEALAARLRQINPAIRLVLHRDRLDCARVADVFAAGQQLQPFSANYYRIGSAGTLRDPRPVHRRPEAHRPRQVRE